MHNHAQSSTRPVCRLELFVLESQQLPQHLVLLLSEPEFVLGPPSVLPALCQAELAIIQILPGLDEVLLVEVVVELGQLALALDRIALALDRIALALDRIALALDRIALAIDRVMFSLNRIHVSAKVSQVLLGRCEFGRESLDSVHSHFKCLVLGIFPGPVNEGLVITRGEIENASPAFQQQPS
jgi:hypothetical protein